MADNKSSVKYEETVRPEDEELVEQETDEEEWDDWNEEEEEGGNDSSSIIKCLFCDYAFDHSRSLFDHCISIHHFDFPTIRRSLSLDFYSSFKLFNYIRSQVEIYLLAFCYCCCYYYYSFFQESYDGKFVASI